MKPRDSFGLDALLGRWPAQDPQEHGGPSWDERADKIVASALALKEQGSPEVIAALVDAPRLEPEPGEESGARGFDVVGPARETERAAGGGAQRMSSDQGKRPSLKELAARASQAGAARPSVSSIPPPSRTSAPPPVSATVTPIAKAKSRASDPGREDSGMLRLADLQKPAPVVTEAPVSAAPAEAAAPSVAAAASKPAVATPAATASGGGSRAGMWAGAAIAVLGIAAALAVYQTRKPEPSRTDTVAEVKPTAAPVATEAPKAEPAAEPTAVSSAEPAPTDAPKADEPKAVASGGAAAPTSTAVASADLKPATATKEAPKGGPVGTLDEEMKKAVGGSDLPSAPQDDGAKPAAGGGGNVPEQPSQGNAQAAIRAVMGGAKACVAGATEPTTASVTFGSSGSVQSVSVGGWAAANGKGGCVKSALQGARVSPFAKPTYTVPVNVRP